MAGLHVRPRRRHPVPFRAYVKDPKGLALWYQESLGVDQTPPDCVHAYWVQGRGPTVFEPFTEGNNYFGDSKYQYMLDSG
jgi:hypothetical protein